MLDFRVATFLCVCQTMNFTRAAQLLNITQPAVSQHIHFLEEAYGMALFRYENKKLSLTAAGQILRKRFVAMKNDEQELLAELRSQVSGIEEISLGVTMTVGEYAIMDPLARMLRAHTERNVRLVFGNTQQLLQMLAAGSIQLALVEGYYPQEEYEHTRYSTEDYIGVCAAAHHFAMPPHRFHNLLQERLLIREEGSGTRNILERNLALYGMKVSDFIHYTEVGNMHTIIGLLLRDAGISFLYRIAVEAELRAGTLREIPLTGFSMQHDFDFIWEKGSIYTDAYTSFCQELRSFARGQDSSNFPDRQGRAGAGSNTPVE